MDEVAICVQCVHRSHILGKDEPRCTANWALVEVGVDYVSGLPKVERRGKMVPCRLKNTDGKCPDYEEVEGGKGLFKMFRRKWR